MPALVRFRISSRRELSDLWEGKHGRQRDQTESGYDFALAGALARTGTSAADIASTLMERPRAKARPAEYFARTAAAACAPQVAGRQAACKR